MARADTSFGEALHIAAGSGFSPNYSNTGAWSNYTAFGVGLQLPRNSLPRDWGASSRRRRLFLVRQSVGCAWRLSIAGIFELERGRNVSQKNVNFDLRYYDTNLSREQCFVLTGDMNGGFGGRTDLVTN